MIHIKNLFNGLVDLFEKRSTYLNLLTNPIVLCIVLTIIILIVQIIYMFDNIKVNDDKFMFYLKYLLLMMLTIFIVIYGYTYLTNLRNREKIDEYIKTDIFNDTTRKGGYNFVEVNPAKYINGQNDQNNQNNQNNQQNGFNYSKNKDISYENDDDLDVNKYFM
jgi:amino acid permease